MLMSNIELLNTMIQLFSVIFIICLVVDTILKRKIPFTKINNAYVSIMDLIYYVLKFLGSTLGAITLTVFTYYSFGTTTIVIADIKSEMAFLFILVLVAFVVSLWINVITTGVNLVYKIAIYIKLRRNTIANNLRHAIANKNEHAMIDNYELIKQTDEVLKITNNEIFILTACLSKFGYDEDMKELLKSNLYKKKSFLESHLPMNTVIFEYNIQKSDDYFLPSNTMKHKLKQFENITTIISIIITIVFILQFVITTFSSTFHIPNTLMLIFVTLTSIIVIALILIKHQKIKKIYRKELAIADLPNDHIKIRKPIIDNILLGLSVFMIVNAIVQVLIY